MKKRLSSLVLALIMIFALLPTSAMAESNEQQIFNYLTEKLSLNTAAACGALANIERESSFNPNAESVDTNGLTSYGICQWNGNRFTLLKEYCDDNGYDWTKLDGQLHYLQREFESSEAYAFSKIKNVSNTKEGAYTAGYNWAKYFERCAENYGGVNQYEQRAASACNTYWVKYGDNSIPTDDSLSISEYNQPSSINQGAAYSIYGTVSSGISNITSLTVGVYSPSGILETGKTVNPNSKMYSISNVDAYVKFGSLSAGTHYYIITATNSSGTKQLLNKQFTVVGTQSLIVNKITECKYCVTIPANCKLLCYASPTDTSNSTFISEKSASYTVESTKKYELSDGSVRYFFVSDDGNSLYLDCASSMLVQTKHNYTATCTEATCTAKGYMTYTCTCGDSYDADFVEPLGHDFVDGVCTRCGEIKIAPGDITGDGKINTKDLVRLQKYISGADAELVGAGDVNGDGEINALDLVRLKKYISGADVELH